MISVGRIVVFINSLCFEEHTRCDGSEFHLIGGTIVERVRPLGHEALYIHSFETKLFCATLQLTFYHMMLYVMTPLTFTIRAYTVV